MILGPGDTLLIYSDGVTEARRETTRGGPEDVDEEFGEERLAASLRRHAGLLLADLPGEVLADVCRFAGTEPQDDRTIVALRGRSQP